LGVKDQHDNAESKSLDAGTTHSRTKKMKGVDNLNSAKPR